MSGSQKYKSSDDVVAREVAGEMVLLDLVSGMYFGLDPVGSRVWARLSDSPAGLSDLADVVEAEFDAPRDVIEQDLVRLLEQLAEKGLVEVDPA